MTHRKEIEHWAKQPDGTKVWHKYTNEDKLWELEEFTYWEKDEIYIVDDEWAELRKAQIDGATLQFKNDNRDWVSINDDWWNNWFYSDHKVYSPKDFRIKPKEWYECIPPEGIPCWVWDDKDEYRKRIALIKSYDTEKPLPFRMSAPCGWRYAEPIKSEECWQRECE